MQTNEMSARVKWNRRFFVSMILALMARTLVWCVPHSATRALNGIILIGFMGPLAFRHHFRHGVKLCGTEDYNGIYVSVEKVLSLAACLALGFPDTVWEGVVNVLLPFNLPVMLLSKVHLPVTGVFRLSMGDWVAEITGCLFMSAIWYFRGQGAGLLCRGLNHAWFDKTGEISADDTSSYTSEKAKELTMGWWRCLQLMLGLVEDPNQPPKSNSAETVEETLPKDVQQKLIQLDEHFMRCPAGHCIFLNTVKIGSEIYLEVLACMPRSKYSGDAGNRHFEAYAQLADSNNRFVYVSDKTVLNKAGTVQKTLQQLIPGKDIKWVKPGKTNKLYSFKVDLANKVEQARIKPMEPDEISELKDYKNLPQAAK